MSIYEYDRDAHIKMEREDAFEDGRLAGLEEGKAAGLEEGRMIELTESIKKKLAKNKSIEQIADELEKEVSVIADMIGKYNL